MALTKLNAVRGITGATPVANGGTALTSGFVNGYTQGSVVTPSGVDNFTFTSIPSGTNSIILTAQNLSTDSGSGSNLYFYLGDSGGYETSGYQAIDAYRGVSADDNDSTAFTGYFGLATGFSASDVWSGNIFLNRISGNFWVMTYTAHDIGQYVRWGAGHKELSAELTSIKFEFQNGNFDNGTCNIQYQ